MSGEDVEERLLRLVTITPKYSIVLASIYAALPTLVTGIAYNLSPQLLPEPLTMFIILYLVTLPVVIVGLHTLYKLVKEVSQICGLNSGSGGSRVYLAPFILGVLPLGFLFPLHYAMTWLAKCRILGSIYRPGILFADALINVFAFGLVTILYGVNLENMLDYVLEKSST